MASGDCGRSGSAGQAVSLTTVYHRTSAGEAARIMKDGFRSQENPPLVYVSNRWKGHATGYGEVVVVVVIDFDRLTLEDEFPDGEKHYTVPVDIMNKHGEILKTLK